MNRVILNVLCNWRLLLQAARDRDADLRRQLAKLAGGQRAQPRKHHLTTRLARACACATARASAPRLCRVLTYRRRDSCCAPCAGASR